MALKIKEAKIPKISGKYSKEIQRVIKYLLQKNPYERPSVEELLNIPEISIRLRRKRLRDNQEILTKRELDIKKKLREIEQKDRDLKAREK